MFVRVADPLAYAESLLQHFASVARCTDSAGVVGQCVRAVAQLSGCELSQLYVLDATHKRLELTAEWLDGLVQPPREQGLPTDYAGQHLLQFAVCQNRVISVDDLSDGLYDIGFLPSQGLPWRALLCVPLLNAQQSVAGVLLVASRQALELLAYAPSVGVFGTFVGAQLRLHQQDATSVMPSDLTGSTSGLIGKSRAMRQTYHLINKVLNSPYTVLLMGETGTGKEVVARAIHDGS